jgi:hypothetical protein
VDNDLTGLARRLAAAETAIQSLQSGQHRGRMQVRLAWGACVLGIAAAVLAGARPAITQDAVSTFRAPFKIEGRDGKKLLEVDTDADGPYLRLFSNEQRSVVSIWSDKDGGNIIIRNVAGKNVGEFASRANDRGGYLTVLNKDGKRAANMQARNDGNGGYVQVYNIDGKGVIDMFARTDGGGEIAVSDKEGKTMAAMFSRDDGDGGDLQIKNKDGKTAAGLFASRGNGYMQLYDSSGKILAKQP